MELRDEFHSDPDCLTPAEGTGEFEIVVPYTDPESTAAALNRAGVLTAGLHAHVLLVAVHTLPYPVPFVCPSGVHAHLVEQLIALATDCPLTVHPQVVLARDRLEGFRYAMKPGSTVLIASQRRLWRTREEQLARRLAEAGHHVMLVHRA